MTTEKILILDTETANSIENPMVYDLGFIVADKQGNIYETQSFAIANIILDKELMDTAYYKEKIPQYWNEIKNGERRLVRLKTAKYILRETIKKYQIEKIYAYNCRFDYTSLTQTQRLCTSSKYRYIYPHGIKFFDILQYARAILKDSTAYTKFCVDNDYLDKRGLNRHTAEIVYQFFFDKNFQEKHKGIDDCLIEYKILLKCFELEPDYEKYCQLWKD